MDASRSRLLLDPPLAERPDAPAIVRQALATPGRLAPAGMRCPACHATVRHRFCSVCGEHAPHRQPRTTGEFLKRGVSRLLDADSRLLRSLSLLLFRPGALANRFLDGHRSHYVGPLQLFAIVNVAFVLFVSASGGPTTFQNQLYYHLTASYPHEAVAQRWVSHHIDAPEGWTVESALQLEDSLQVHSPRDSASAADASSPGDERPDDDAALQASTVPAIEALSRYRDYAKTFNRQTDRLAEALVFLFIPALAGLFWGGAYVAGALPGSRRGLASIVQATHYMAMLLLLLASTIVPLLGIEYASRAAGASELPIPPTAIVVVWVGGFSVAYLTASLRRVERASWPRAITQAVVVFLATFFFQRFYTAILFFVVYVLTR